MVGVLGVLKEGIKNQDLSEASLNFSLSLGATKHILLRTHSWKLRECQ